MSCTLFFLVPQFPPQSSMLSVFRIAEQPSVIVRGFSGSTLTVNIAFGDDEVEQWLQSLQQPYPQLFIDMEWANRFPNTVLLLKEKNFPLALLGTPGEQYIENPTLLQKQIDQFEKIFDYKPLWFRTYDEQFPPSLLRAVWEEEINAIGSTTKWAGGKIPPESEGEIIAVSSYREAQMDFQQLEQLQKSRTFLPLEDVLIKTSIKTKKLP